MQETNKLVAAILATAAVREGLGSRSAYINEYEAILQELRKRDAERATKGAEQDDWPEVNKELRKAQGRDDA
jgi:hypothetical protein